MWESLSNDPLFGYLRKFGYNTVRLPRENIEPLQLFTKNGNQLNCLGNISEAFISRGNIDLPPIQRNNTTSKISGKRSGELSIGTALSLLNGFLSNFGGSAISLQESYQHAKSISFEYGDVYEDTVQIIQLDKFLNDADINPFAKCVGKMLDADEVRVCTSTIKSNKISVIPTSQRNNEVKLDVPEIKKTVGANVKVSVDEKESSSITFEGNKALVFGFQVARLYYDKGKITRIKPEEKVMLGTKNDSLISKNPFVSIGE